MEQSDLLRVLSYRKCYHCGAETHREKGMRIGFIRDSDAGFFESTKEQWLCPDCIEARKTNLLVGQPKQSASFLVRAANTKPEGWGVMAVLGFFFVVVPVVCLLRMGGTLPPLAAPKRDAFDKQSQSWTPQQRQAFTDKTYRGQFSSEQERLNFEAQVRREDALKDLNRDAPVGGGHPLDNP